MNISKYYYNKDKAYSFKSAGIWFFIIFGGRGTGKTTCFKMDWVDKFIEKKKRFLWIRRYGTELYGKREKNETPGCVPGFFNKLQDINEKYAKYELTTKGNTAFINKEDAGLFMSLSTSQAAKGTDGRFKDIDTIIFDEFLIMPGSKYNYLKNEVTIFLDLINTVFRPGLKDAGTVVLLANAITFANPYFLYFRIPPMSPNQRFYVDKRRGILVEQYSNAAYEEKVRQTNFGRLISGTDYEEYAVDNKFLLDTDDFICKKTPQASFIFNIRFDAQEWGVYADEQFVFVTNGVDRTRPFFTFTKADHRSDSIMIKGVRGTRFELLIKNYQLGLVMFENIMIKSKFVDLLALFLSK